MVGFFELRIDFIYVLHGLALALIAGSAWGLLHIENRRTWSWLAFFAAFQAAFVWLKAIGRDFGDTEIFYATRVALLGVSYFCLVQFARRRLFGFGLLRLRSWIHIVPGALLFVGIFWIGRDFLKWYIPILALLGGVLAGFALLARSRSHRCKNQAARLRGCAFAVSAYAIIHGFLALPEFVAGQDGTIHPWLPLLAACISLCLASAASWAVGLHYALLHHARLLSENKHWARKRVIQLGVIFVIVACGWFSADRARALKDDVMRNDILQRTRLLAASIPLEQVATFKWDHTDLNNPHYQEVKQRMIAQVKANPDIRFFMLMGLRDGHSYFLVDSEAPDSPDYSPPGQHYEDAEAGYLEQVARHTSFVMGPISDRWGSWISASVPLGPIGDSKNWVTADADISAANWQAMLRSARLPALLVTLLFTLIFLTYFYAQDRIHETLARLTISEGRTSTLVEGSPNCVQMFDVAGICTTINQNGLNALDRRRDEVVGRHFLSIWPERRKKAIKESFDFTLTGHSTVFESDYERPDGVAIIWRVALTPVLDEQRRVTSLVSIGVDISDLKQTEKDLLAAKDAAEAATRAKSEFLAVMSHEIRTPLGGVIGMLNVLRKHQMEPEQQLYTELAHENAENLLGMLDEILDAAKVDAGKLTLESIPFEPIHEFRCIFEPMRVRAHAKGLNFKWTFAPELPAILHGDPTRLRQVLANLVSNALKFTEQGGIATIISATPANPGCVNLCIEVTDTGIGIEPDRLNRLFAKFEQVDISTTRKFGGTGLGLSIVKSLAELMNGSVQVQSNPGTGTTFTFTAMLKTGTAADLANLPGTTPPLTTLPRHRAKLHILCAEDDLTNQVAAEFLAKQMGHVIEFVTDGEMAIDWLSCNRADVVLMDNRMPVMDGFQATKAIRDPATITLDHDIYIIANTANAGSGYRERCLAAGMNDYLTKPLREEALHVALEKAILHLEKRGIPLTAPDEAPQPRVFTAPAATAIPGSDPGMSEDELLAILDEAESQLAAPPQLPEDALRRIVEQYHIDAPQRLSDMRQSFAASDLVSLARAAHSLKGTSRYIQAEALSRLCAEIEKRADGNEIASLSDLISQAEAEYASLIKLRSPTSPASAS